MEWSSSYLSPSLSSRNDFPKSWFSNETGDFRDKRNVCVMPAAICPRTKHETIPCILGENRSIRQLSMEKPPRSHPTLPPPRNLGTGPLLPLQPPNGRIALLIPFVGTSVENRAFTWNILATFRCVSLRFSFFFFLPPVRKTQAKGRFRQLRRHGILRWEGEFPFRWYSFRSTRSSSFRCCLRAPPPTIPLRDKGILDG